MTDAEKIKMLREELRKLAAVFHEQQQHKGTFDECGRPRCLEVMITLHSTGEEE